MTRSSAGKARTNAFNTLWGVMIGAPSPLRDELLVLSKKTLVNRCLRLRPEAGDLLGLVTDPDRLLMAGVKTALRDLARRWKQLDDEVKTLNKQIEALVRAAAPELLELHGVGIEITGQFLVTAGDNADRIRSEAAFAKLCGVAPSQPAAAAPAAVTDSAAATTAPPTAPCTSSPSSECDATTNRPATTSNAAPPKD